jgi:hypothetical protein
MMSPGRLWWFLKRDLKRGWDATYNDYRTKPRIADWSWPFWKETPQDVPVHVLTGAKDWQLCCWMLASWFHYTEETWNIVIHDDGTLPTEARAELKRLFPNARIINRDDADAKMDKVLTPYPFCHDYRNKHPLALKIFDFPNFTLGERFIALDSDVLFFSYPREIMEWAMNLAKECWFNEDVEEGSLITPDHARTDLGIKLWRKVNSGLCLVTKEAIDLEFCERALGETSILKGHIWRVEQTLFALCASRYGKGGLLPPTYEVSLGKHSKEGIVARHYVGAVRDRFYGEGLKRLRDILLAKAEV